MKVYETPELEILVTVCDDIITTSGGPVEGAEVGG